MVMVTTMMMMVMLETVTGDGNGDDAWEKPILIRGHTNTKYKTEKTKISTLTYE